MEDSDLANILVVNNANRIEYVVLRQYPVKPSRCLYKPAGPWVASSSTPSPLSDPTAANNENNKNNINIINNNSSVNDTSPLHSWPTLQLTRMSHFRSSLLFKELERALDHGFAAMWLRKDRSRLTLDDLLDDAVVDMCDCELWIFSWSVRCPASSYIPESSLVHESTRGEFTSMDIYDTAGSATNNSTQEYALFLEGMQNLFERKLGYTRLGCYLLRDTTACDWPTRGIHAFRLFIYLAYGKLVIQPVQSIIQLEQLSFTWLRKHIEVTKEITVFVAPYGIRATIIPANCAHSGRVLLREGDTPTIQITFMDAYRTGVDVSMQSIFVPSNIPGVRMANQGSYEGNADSDELLDKVVDCDGNFGESRGQFRVLDSTLANLGELDNIYDALDAAGGETETPPATHASDGSSAVAGSLALPANSLGLTAVQEKDAFLKAEESNHLAFPEPPPKQQLVLISPVPKPENYMDLDMSMNGLGDMGGLTDLTLGGGVTDEDFDFFETKKPSAAPTPRATTSFATPGWTSSEMTSSSSTYSGAMAAAGSFTSADLPSMSGTHSGSISAHGGVDLSGSALISSPAPALTPRASAHHNVFSPYAPFTTPRNDPMSPMYPTAHSVAAIPVGAESSPYASAMLHSVSPTESSGMVFGSPQFLHGDAATPHFAQSSPPGNVGMHMPVSPATHAAALTVLSPPGRPGLSAADRFVSMVSDPSSVDECTSDRDVNHNFASGAFEVDANLVQGFHSSYCENDSNIIDGKESDGHGDDNDNNNGVGELEKSPVVMSDAWLPFRIVFDLVFGHSGNSTDGSIKTSTKVVASGGWANPSSNCVSDVAAAVSDSANVTHSRYGNLHAKWCYIPKNRRIVKQQSSKKRQPGEIQTRFGMRRRHVAPTSAVVKLVQRTLELHGRDFHATASPFAASGGASANASGMDPVVAHCRRPIWRIGDFYNFTVLMPIETGAFVSQYEALWHTASGSDGLGDVQAVRSKFHPATTCVWCSGRSIPNDECECCMNVQSVHSGKLVGALAMCLPVPKFPSALFDLVRTILATGCGENDLLTVQKSDLVGPLSLLEYHDLQETDKSVAIYGGFQVRKKKRTSEPIVSVMPIPNIVFRHDGALLTANILSYRFWTKLRLEPYSGLKRLAYIALYAVSHDSSYSSTNTPEEGVIPDAADLENDVDTIQLRSNVCSWLLNFQQEWAVHRFGEINPLMDTADESVIPVHISNGEEFYQNLPTVLNLFSASLTEPVCKRVLEFLNDVSSPYLVPNTHNQLHSLPSNLSTYCTHLCLFVFIPPAFLRSSLLTDATPENYDRHVHLSAAVCNNLANLVSERTGANYSDIHARIVFKAVVAVHNCIYPPLVEHNDCHDVYNQCQWVLPPPAPDNGRDRPDVKSDNALRHGCIPAPTVVLDDKRVGKQAFLVLPSRNSSSVGSKHNTHLDPSCDEAGAKVSWTTNERLLIEPTRVAYVVYETCDEDSQYNRLIMRWSDHRGELSGAVLLLADDLESRADLFRRLIDVAQSSLGYGGFLFRLVVCKMGDIHRVEMQDWMRAISAWTEDASTKSVDTFETDGPSDVLPQGSNTEPAIAEQHSKLPHTRLGNGDTLETPIELDESSDTTETPKASEKPVPSYIISITIACLSTWGAIQCSRPLGATPFGPLIQSSDDIWSEDTVSCTVFALPHHRPPLPTSSWSSTGPPPYLPLASGWLLKGTQSVRLSLMWHARCGSRSNSCYADTVVLDRWEMTNTPSPSGSSSSGYLAPLATHVTIVRDILKQLYALNCLYGGISSTGRGDKCMVSRVESYKYLGVLIDSKLDHSAWLKQKRSALKHTISALHPVLTNHQLTVNYRSRIFSAVVMGKAYYGLELIGGNKSHLAPLQTTINKGIRLFTGARLSTAIGPLLVETGIGSLLTRSLVSRVRLLERSVTKRTPINVISSGTDNDVFTLNVQGQLVRSQRWFWSRRTKPLYRNRYWLTPQVRPKTVKQRHSFALMETLRTCGDSASLQKYVTRQFL
ncbi:hypothetical protein BASA81_012185 [Batrachochytrium salamandrivorans]|nr:hypothetical protein BASA81_012185 [Batrachochytrium salamandrivorans]